MTASWRAIAAMSATPVHTVASGTTRAAPDSQW